MQVPVLFDKKTMTIVNNESADIVRMFATELKVYFHPLVVLLVRKMFDCNQLQYCML